MADNAVHQIISAYTTGCLDKENFIQFIKYMEGGGELPKGEMGELQNVTALIPTLLEVEEPSVELKNKVAKRILEIEADRKEKIKKTEEKKQEPAVEVVEDQSEKGTEVKKVNEPVPEKTIEKEPSDDDVVEPAPKLFSKQTMLPWILLGIIGIILIIVIIYFFYSKSQLNDEIADINNRLHGYQNEVVQTNKFINEHIELIEFLNYKNVEIVNFMPTEVKPDAYGKLFISLDAGEAILQLKNMPKITSRESYQLWMVNETQSYSLDTIFPSPGVEYYKIKNLPSLDKKDIMMFRITKEIRGGSESPQGQLYLFGAFYSNREEDQPTGRRR